MLSTRSVKSWYLVHKWTSVVCTAFLLMFCLTGLPLIFHHEIDELTRAPQVAEDVQGSASLDSVVIHALTRHPGWHLLFLSFDDEKPIIYAAVGPTLDAGEEDGELLQYDARSGEPIDAPPFDEGVMAFLLDLHANLLLGIPGQLFLGLVGLVFLTSVISGVVVYAPFMRKLPFGTVRKARSKRLKWLDTHNMVGIVTLGWVSVVGLTGFIITMTVPIQAIWQMDELAEMAAPYEGSEPPATLTSVDAAVATVKDEIPDAHVSFIAWPGTAFSTKHHYMLALTGDTPLTERLISPTMIDAANGQLTDARDMPWYVQMLFLSVPLHFGDYGGLTLKIIWALLDIAAIVVLVSGLYLWLDKRRVPIEQRLAELNSGGLVESNG